MGPTVAATAYGLAAMVAAFVFRPRSVPNRDIFRAAVFWVLSVPVLFILPLPMLMLATCGALAFALAPPEKGDRLAFYLLVFPAVPATVFAQVPFPGINYLFMLDFPRVVFFCVLTAAFLSAARPPAARYAPTIGVFVVLLTLLFSVMAFRDENLTNGLRMGFNYALIYALPFFALVRLMNTDESLDKVFSSFMFLACILGFTALVSQATKWNIYDFVSMRVGQPVFAEFRGGFLRIAATLNVALTGFVMGLGLIAVSYFRSRRRLGFLMASIYRALFAAGAFFTYSRGAWIAVILGLLVYLFFTKAPRGLRPAMIAAGVFIGAPAAIVFALNADFGAIDAYGTFAYRQELLRATWIHFQQYPLFGDALFYSRPHFAHLVQGEGIIDFVNRYVQIVVEYGAVGLIIFLTPWIVLVLGLLKLPGRHQDFWGSPAEHQRAALLAIIASFLFLTATSSDVTYFKQFGVAILAIGAGYIGAVRAKRAGQTAADPAAARGDLDQPDLAEAAARPA
ncbi:MAG: O-antigen ligase family protein [Parvularculaceae bacterium]|nr:O-antigen ligase family protein [Parvularculaceae bacterium]